MGKLFKIILSGIAFLVLLLILAICILPFVIDLNNFKLEIAAAVKNKTGKELLLDGEIKLSMFPWFGISTGKIALKNTTEPQDQPIASIEESDVKILLLPLLSKKIEINHIILKGLVLNLARDKQSITPWNDLSAPSQVNTPPPAPNNEGQPIAAIAAFAIDSISIENARINWDDLKNNKHFEIQNLNLNANKFSFDEPAGIAATFTAVDKLSKNTLAIKLNTELSVNEQLDTFALRHNELQLTSSGNTTANVTIADMALDLAKQTAKIYGLLLKVGDMSLTADLTATALMTKPSLEGKVAIAPFNPVNLMQQLSIAQPATALTRFAANFDLTATSDLLDMQNLVMILDESQIKGSVTFKDFTAPNLSFNLDVDAFDADHYLPASDKNAKVIASPGVLMAASLMALPNKFNVDGLVSLGKLKIVGLSMQGARINLTSQKGILTAQQSIKQFYQGSYSGALSVDKQGDKPKLSVNEKIERVQIEPLLKDYQGKARISGVVNASSKLQAQGNNADELKATLGGQISFMFADGAVKGFNLQKIIDEGKALFKGSAMDADYKNEQTLFSLMSGTAMITNGLVQNNDLVASSSKLRVDGQGSLNLNTEALDYKIDAKLLEDATEPEPIKGAMTLNIAGTLSKPTYSIDLASLLTDKNKAKIDKLINKIDKKIGSGLGNLLKSFIK